MLGRSELDWKRNGSEEIKGRRLFAAQGFSLAGLLGTHSRFIMAPVRHDFCVIACVMGHVSERRLLMCNLWGNLFHQGRCLGLLA